MYMIRNCRVKQATFQPIKNYICIICTKGLYMYKEQREKKFTPRKQRSKREKKEEEITVQRQQYKQHIIGTFHFHDN